MRRSFPWLFFGWLAISTGGLDAVIFLDTSDTQHNRTSPGDNSGWQYEGKFGVYLGVPIAPHFFITAKHIGGSVGDSFILHGDTYTTIARYEAPNADLRIWEVDHAKPFLTYAPLSSGAVDVGSVVTVIGRGTQRGSEVIVGGELKGWRTGSADNVQRWGRNVVTRIAEGGASFGELLFCAFDRNGIKDECHLSVGDSGGGMFVFEDGLWRLAGIHYAVDGRFRESASETPYNAVLFDMGGLERQNSIGGYVAEPDVEEDVPSGFYSSRIAFSLPWITGIVPEVGALAPQSYAAWQTLYFSPALIASGDGAPMADPDEDGVVNLLEFAFNLDPLFAEPKKMETDEGFRGVPVEKMITTGGQSYLSIEFMSRTEASAGNLTYVAEFSADLENWTEAENLEIEPINSRWDRVKATDSVPMEGGMGRFARVRVVLAE